MTPEEKLDAIHDAVMAIKADMAARQTICEATHRVVDSRLDGLHKKFVGNGQPGLEQKHAELETRFDKFETKVVAWATVAVFVAQIVMPKLTKVMGW